MPLKKLYLLDGMALVYRAHFALISRPIMTSSGVNSSALYGFTQTLIELIRNEEPTHIAVAFDTSAPTARHLEYTEYKAQREEMPEDLSKALPQVRRLLEAFRIPILTLDGYEADDIIGTLAKRAEKEGYITCMVTPDKDFGQLVDTNTLLYKPSRMGDAVEILGVPEVLKKWNVARVEQVIDVLGLWGDTSDNIPGVPGIGEKTAQKLIAEYGSVENILAHTGEMKGKLRDRLEEHREQALLCKRLATIDCSVPIDVKIEDLVMKEWDKEALMEIFAEFEFRTLPKRLFGEIPEAALVQSVPAVTQKELFPTETEPEPSSLRTIADTPHSYRFVQSESDRSDLVKKLAASKAFCFDTETTSIDPKEADLIGMAFCFEEFSAYYVEMPDDRVRCRRVLEEFRRVFENPAIEKVGHNLKFDVLVLRWHGIRVAGRFFDTMLAHSLCEPEMRHRMDYLAEVILGYRPISIESLIGEKKKDQLTLRDVSREKVAEYAAEDADVTWQLRARLEPLLRKKGQERVFYDIENPLLPVLADMEFEGVRVDLASLEEASVVLSKEIASAEADIFRMAGESFNLNSPKRLGEILFDVLKIAEKPKKTKTGQYATNEQTLIALASRHEIVARVLAHRVATKLKSTYVDALPGTVWSKTGNIHTTYSQAVTATGRLQSQSPNLQNIPIRTEQGREIRKAFVPRDEQHLLLSADYSQIELRVIASLSGDKGMIEAFAQNLDIHAATAAKVFGVGLSEVTAEMRRKAKMVNFGIAYGISAFGLSQRLGISRSEAADIIEAYFKQYSGIRRYMRDTIHFAREHGYVETVTGRRRYLRDIKSGNATVRGAAERNAINAPIQGTAADMIKIAMVNVHAALFEKAMKTRMLLQVHDELVFDLWKPEEEMVRQLIVSHMKNAILLAVPIEVEIGVGKNWLEAH